MGVRPWGPLAGGCLSGRYRREDTQNPGRRSGPNPFGDSKFTDRHWEVLDTLKAVAAELDRPVAQVALSWVMARPGVASTLVGASKPEQLVGAIAATEIMLSDSQMARLNAVSAPPASFSAALTSPMIRRMVFGDHAVTGWGE